MAAVPDRPLFHNGWWLVPLADDRSPLPARALERVQAIYQAGIRPKAFLVAHEATPQLPAPAGTPRQAKLEFWASQLAGHSETLLQVAGVVVTTLSAVLVAAGAGLGLLVLLGLAGAAALVDPCLIVVTEDDVWIVIDAWMA